MQSNSSNLSAYSPVSIEKMKMYNTAYRRAKPQPGRGIETHKDMLTVVLDDNFDWHKMVYKERFNQD